MTSPRSRRPLPEGHPYLEHLDALPLAVIELDDRGAIRGWTGSAERLLGWAAAEVLGRTLSSLDLVPEADAALVESIGDRLGTGRDRPRVHRCRIRTRAGEVRHTEWTRIPLGLRGGPQATLCYVLDVTAQVEAERSAMDARAELERCLLTSPEGICELDRGYRITQWNPAAERMLGRGRAEVVGRGLLEVFPVLRGTTFHRAFDEALADGHLRVVEDRAPQGRTWYSVTALPSAHGLTVFFANVTGRRQLERELLAMDAEQKRTRPS
jgi:PAS domain S-box-containing protein